jgi:hypothetical protein
MRTFGYAIGLVVAVAVLLGADRSSSDVSNQATLLVLLVAAAVMGLSAPRRAWLPGLVLGAAIPLAHIVYLTAGPALPYKSEPAGVGGAATLLVLIVPAMIAAYLGAGVARVLHNRRPSALPPA